MRQIGGGGRSTPLSIAIWTVAAMYRLREAVITPKAPFARYNLLSNRLSNRIDNRLYRVYKHSTGCQTQPVVIVKPGLATVSNEQDVRHGCQTGCQTRLTAGLTTGCIVYTNIQPVVKTV